MGPRWSFLTVGSTTRWWGSNVLVILARCHWLMYNVNNWSFLQHTLVVTDMTWIPIVIPKVLFTPIELKDEDSIRRAVAHSNIVINLVIILLAFTLLSSVIFNSVGTDLGNSELLLWGREHHWTTEDCQSLQGDGGAEAGAYVPHKCQGGARGCFPQGGKQVLGHQVPGRAGSQGRVPWGNHLQVCH